FTQELTITLTHPVGGLPHCALRHSEFASSIGRGRAIRVVCERFLKLIEQSRRRRTSCTIFVSKPCQRLVKHAQRPTALVDLIRSRCICRLKTHALALMQILQWD